MPAGSQYPPQVITKPVQAPAQPTCDACKPSQASPRHERLSRCSRPSHVKSAPAVVALADGRLPLGWGVQGPKGDGEEKMHSTWCCPPAQWGQKQVKGKGFEERQRHLQGGNTCRGCHTPTQQRRSITQD